MISPQLHPDSSASCPPGAPVEPFNVSLEHTRAPLDEARLVVALAPPGLTQGLTQSLTPDVAPGMRPELEADISSQSTADAVFTGLWHCLLGGLAAGLGVSAILGLLVLALNLLN